MPIRGAGKLAAGGAIAAFLLTTACQRPESPAVRLADAVHTRALLERAAAEAVQARAPSEAERADAALTAGRTDEAIAIAEAAVRLRHDDFEARSVLARAYFAAGRFISAQQAYHDLQAMRPDNAGMRFRAALTALALGDVADARAALGTLEENAGLRSDVGLAYVLMGDVERGIALLTAVVRSGTSIPRDRQNLALAQALSGKWNAARVTAAIDLDPAAVSARVAEWAALASSSDPAWRVAMLMDVRADPEDAGRPTMLAWAPAQEAEPALLAEAPPPPPASKEPVVKPAPVPAAAAEPPAPTASMGEWVVQLGSYDRAAYVSAGWQGLRRGTALLRTYEPLQSKVEIGGRTYYRLSVGRFASADAAEALCRELKSDGRDCFVRRGRFAEQA